MRYMYININIDIFMYVVNFFNRKIMKIQRVSSGICTNTTFFEFSKLIFTFVASVVSQLYFLLFDATLKKNGEC